MLVASASGTVDGEAELRRRLSGWELEAVGATSLVARAQASVAIELHFGHQFATRERLELLVFGTTIAPEHESTTVIVERALDTGAIVVLPWGAGKWWGDRGRLVRAACERFAGRTGFFLADSAVRPRGWRMPASLALAAQAGVRVISGTDPLPVPNEEDRVGSYSFEVAPATEFRGGLIEAMQAPGTDFIIHGQRISLANFCRTQASLRLRKR